MDTSTNTQGTALRSGKTLPPRPLVVDRPTRGSETNYPLETNVVVRSDRDSIGLEDILEDKEDFRPNYGYDGDSEGELEHGEHITPIQKEINRQKEKEEERAQDELNLIANRMSDVLIPKLVPKLISKLESSKLVEPKVQEPSVAPTPISLTYPNGMGDNANQNNHPSYSRPTHAPRQMGPRRFMKCDLYDGTTSWSDFLAHFERIAHYNGWEDEEKALWLGNSLRGDAMCAVNELDLSLQRHYPSVVECLERRCGTKGKTEVFQQILENRKRKPGEPLMALANEVRRLVRMAYPTTDQSLAETLAKNYFLKALTNTKIQRKIQANSFSTFDDVVMFAIKLETIYPDSEISPDTSTKKVRRQGFEPSQKSQSTSEQIEQAVRSAMKEYTQELHTLRNDMDSITTGANNYRHSQGAYRSRNDRDRSDRGQEKRCFNCHQLGHFARACPGFRRAQNQGNFQ